MNDDRRPPDSGTARRKRAEAALRESERRFAELVEVSEDLICTHDLEGRILSANPAMARQLGYAREDLVGRLLSDFLSEQTRHEFPDYLAHVARDGQADGFMRVVTRSGENRVFQYDNVLRETDAGAPIVFGVAHDVQRKWAEQALRLSVNRLEALLNNIPDAAWMKDEHGRFIAVNEAFARSLGKGRDDVLGKTDFDFLTPPVAERYREEDRSVLSTGRSLRLNDEILRADGQRTFVETIKTPIRGGAGRASGTVGIARDVSERRSLEDQLAQSHKMEAIGRLAGGIAHDFNNLLTTILGYTDLLLGQLSADSDLRADIQEIGRAGQRAAALTRQLLAFSRKQIVEPQVLDLNELVLDVSKMLRRLIGENIELITTLAPQLARIRADPGQMEQVLLNLAVNARDAMPSGGRLVIETHNVGGAAGPPDVLLVVRDTGVGMSEETRRHLFEPFYTTKDVGKGTGLGLATVYGIVTQSGGQVRVESEPDQGATFEVRIPGLAESAAEPAVRAGVPGPLSGGWETVLLVEDEAAVRALARRVLEDNGYSVLTAANAEETLEVLRRHGGPIDLLVTDVVMPGTSGLQLARRLVAERPDMKVLYISGYTDAFRAEGGAVNPERDLLLKPFAPERLAARVREILDGRLPG